MMFWSASDNYRFAIECLKRLYHQTGIFCHEIEYLMFCDLGAYYMEASYPAKRVESA